MVIFKALRVKIFLLLVMGLVLALLSWAPLKVTLERRIHGVKREVNFLDLEMRGLLKDEVRELVRGKAHEFQREPVDAKEDPLWRDGVIPHMWGSALDVEETTRRIVQAQRGERIEPVIREVVPEVSLEDFPGRPVFRGNPLKSQVAFMINVAWGEEHLPAMLEVMEGEGVLATFFLTGRWTENNGDTAAELLRRGHELASHGYDDGLVLKGLTVEEAAGDIRHSLDVIEAWTGAAVRWFTPHKGEYDFATLKASETLGLKMMLWSLDTADWLKPGVDRMLERTVEKAFGGAVILMHPTEAGPEYLSRALPLLREKGLEVVPAGVLLDPRYHQDPGKEGRGL